MGAVRLLLHAELRNRWRSWIGMVLLVGLAGGIVLLAVAGARRTASAYDRFVIGSSGHDALILGAQFNLELDDVARLPEVAGIAPVAYVFTIEPGGSPQALTPLVAQDEAWFTHIDRPKVLEGRRPDPGQVHEIAITPPLAESRNLRVGSTLTLLTYVPEQLGSLFDEPSTAPAGPVVTLRVVGIEVTPNEGELTSSVRSGDNLHLTPAFYRTYAGRIAMGSALAVRLKGGVADLPAFQAGVERIAGGRPVEVTRQADEGAPVRRATHLQAVAIGLFAGLATLAGALTVGQAFSRQTFLAAADHPTLGALGMTRRERWTTAMLRSALIGIGGGLVAVGVAVATSPLMPLGVARLAEPDPGLSVDGLVLGVGLVTVPLLSLALTALPAWRVAVATPTRTVEDAEGRPVPLAERLARAGLPPAAVNGVRLAVDPGRGRTAAPTRSAILGATFSIAAVVTAVTFGASLDRLFSTPRLYGWNWDLTVGNPYLADLSDTVVPVLSQSDDVGGFSAVAVTEVEVSGERTQALGMTPVKGSVLPPILDGRAPIQPDEVTLGAKTMRDTGRSIGDLVDVRVGDTTATLRVVGKAVFPVLGTFDVDGLGEGALFTGEGLRRVVPGAQQNIFVVRLAAAADPAEAKDSLSRALGEIGGPAGPQAPSTVADLGRVDDMPLILSGLLAGMASVTLAHALVITMSRRRRDLAVLKTLGFVRRQVRATVAWQATTMTALALVAGLPLGIATGRWAWHLFGDALGIVPEPVVPALVVVLIVPAALVAANLVAAVPAWAAARTRPSAVLRTE